MHFRRWEAALAARTALAVVAVTLTAGRCLTACSFPDEGEGQVHLEPPPRWPWAPTSDESSSGESSSTGEAEAASESSGDGSSGPMEPCDSDEDCGDLRCDTTGNCVPQDESSSGSTDDSSESSAGDAPSSYGPCDRACAAPWGCTQAGGWEACVLGCSTDDDCPGDGTCSGGECHLPCPCPEGAMCADEAGICWWPQ